jgi:CubicO group peptidase (beta-lactamase class C family)
MTEMDGTDGADGTDGVGGTGGVANRLAARVVASGVAPDCAVGCAIRREGQWHREMGGAVDLFFDLASVTKPMTAMAVALAGMNRRTALGNLVPMARNTASERVPLELFLAHRAGLEGHRSLFAPLLRGEDVDIRAALREAANARRDDARGDPPADGFAPLYSDLGYVLAGEALARATGARDAGEAIERLVLEPLKIADQAGTIRELGARGVTGPFAPTETVAWRGGPVVGAVHDENAWALTGRGGSGHAGIFATVGAVLTFGAAVLDALEGVGLPFGTGGASGTGGAGGAGVDVGWLVRQRPGGTLRAGFDGKSEEGSLAGNSFSVRSFGHFGFTGTSVWIDPDVKVVVALLTNRVCPSRNQHDIRQTRPIVHNALREWAIALHLA